MKKHNFSAGPSILPISVFEQASQAVIEFENTGLSILEISHRSKEFISVLERAKANVLELSGLTGKGYQVLFLQGGASMQFLMTAYNLLQNKAAYIDTGVWAHNALKEAQLIGNIDVIASSKDNGYRNIPKQIEIKEDYDYLHFTTNNTIYGTQFHSIPDVNIPLIADMSSDIFSREMSFEKFSLIYAGAQKNIGIAGATLVIIREDILGKVSRVIPTLLDYQVHIKNESMANTPSTYAIYVSYLTMEWLKNQGGCKSIEVQNKEKAELLYNEIDRNPLFEGYANKEDRSMMNAVFTLTDEKLTERFDNFWKEAGISGLKGHRTTGGYRASIYNAMPLESVKLLVKVMQDFEKLQ